MKTSPGVAPGRARKTARPNKNGGRSLRFRIVRQAGSNGRRRVELLHAELEETRSNEPQQADRHGAAGQGHDGGQRGDAIHDRRVHQGRQVAAHPHGRDERHQARQRRGIAQPRQPRLAADAVESVEMKVVTGASECHGVSLCLPLDSVESLYRDL